MARTNRAKSEPSEKWQVRFAQDDYKKISHKLHCRKSNSNFRYNIKCIVENMILHEIFRVVSRFPRYTFYVILRKIDFLWDSVSLELTTRIFSLHIPHHVAGEKGGTRCPFNMPFEPKLSRN